MPTIKRIAACFCAAILIATLLASTPVPDCHGCDASLLGSTSTGPQGGWNFTVSIGVTSGQCTSDGGAPPECVAESCQTTVLVSGTGVASTGYNVCYEQTGAPKYCVTPAPTTDASGNVNLTLTRRTGCGNEMTFEASGPNGESKASAKMECKPCVR